MTPARALHQVLTWVYTPMTRPHARLSAVRTALQFNLQAYSNPRLLYMLGAKSGKCSSNRQSLSVWLSLAISPNSNSPPQSLVISRSLMTISSSCSVFCLMIDYHTGLTCGKSQCEPIPASAYCAGPPSTLAQLAGSRPTADLCAPARVCPTSLDGCGSHTSEPTWSCAATFSPHHRPECDSPKPCITPTCRCSQLPL